MVDPRRFTTPSEVVLLYSPLHGYRRKQTPHRSLENADNLPNDTVCTLAQLLGHIVPFIHDKVLVEDLEDLPTL